MLAEQIALTIAGQAAQKGLNKLPVKSKEIILNSIMGIFGIALIILSISKLSKEIKTADE